MLHMLLNYNTSTMCWFKDSAFKYYKPECLTDTNVFSQISADLIIFAMQFWFD